MKVVLDCDPGNGIPGSDVDDGLALSYLRRHPSVELLGVTVVAGNTSLEDGAKVALSYAQRFAPDLPVHLGAQRALWEAEEAWVTRRRRVGLETLVQDLWAGSPEVETSGQQENSRDAAGFLVQQVMNHPHEVTVVAVGPLTNVALALVREPAFAKAVGRVLVMGGGFHVDSHLQELNFAMDPEAADLVMGSGMPVTLVPLDATLGTSLSTDRLAGWAGHDAETDWLVDTTGPWIRFVERGRGVHGMALHDPAAAVLALVEAVSETADFTVGVELAGRLTRGRAVRWQLDSLRLADGLKLPSRGTVSVVTELNNERLLSALEEVFLA